MGIGYGLRFYGFGIVLGQGFGVDWDLERI